MCLFSFSRLRIILKPPSFFLHRKIGEIICSFCLCVCFITLRSKSFPIFCIVLLFSSSLKTYSTSSENWWLISSTLIYRWQCATISRIWGSLINFCHSCTKYWSLPASKLWLTSVIAGDSCVPSLVSFLPPKPAVGRTVSDHSCVHMSAGCRCGTWTRILCREFFQKSLWLYLHWTSNFETVSSLLSCVSVSQTPQCAWQIETSLLNKNLAQVSIFKVNLVLNDEPACQIVSVVSISY